MGAGLVWDEGEAYDEVGERRMFLQPLLKKYIDMDIATLLPTGGLTYQRHMGEPVFLRETYET